MALKKPENLSPPGFDRRAAELRSAIRLISPALLAARTGCDYEELDSGSGCFRLQLYEAAVTGSYPSLKFYSADESELPEFHQLLLLYYFFTADGSPVSGRYVSFADLPDGRMYAQAFQGYSGNELVKNFGQDIEGFKECCLSEGGQSEEIGDAAFLFRVLPRVNIQVIYWQGDDEFSSACKVLFDASATHYLPIDAFAIIGSNISRRLIKRYLMEAK